MDMVAVEVKDLVKDYVLDEFLFQIKSCGKLNPHIDEDDAKVF